MSIKITWFKTLWLNSDERAALKKAKQLEDSPEQQVTYAAPSETDKPYKNLYYSNKTVTVVLTNGIVISKHNVERDELDRIINAKTSLDLEDLLTDKTPDSFKQAGEHYETDEDRELIKKNLQVLIKSNDFEVIQDQVYLKGVKLALPVIISATFIEILEKQLTTSNPLSKADLGQQYHALKMFWLKLALNSLPQSRQDLLYFVKNNDVRITNNGNIVLYRRIVSMGKGDTKLTKYISKEYYRIKKMKKGPKNYFVVTLKNGKTIIHKSPNDNGVDKIEGNLHDLYKNLGKRQENEFTSAHNRGKLTIRIGNIYNIPDSEIDLDNSICASGGLHAAAVNYNYSGFGDTPVVVLVNPSKAITVPRGEIGKLRTTEMFIAAINDKPQGQHWDDDSLSSFDEEYHDLSVEELEQALETKNFSSLTVKDEVPDVTLLDIKTITEMLKTRVTTI